MFPTVGDQASLWESLLLDEVRRLPEELARIDALLDDEELFARLRRCSMRGSAGHRR